MSETVVTLLALMEKAAILATAAFLLSLVRPFQRVVIAHRSNRRIAALIVIFGIISVSGSHLGIRVMGIGPNMRAIGILVAGLIGGPWVGALVGLIGGSWFALVVREGAALWPHLVLVSVIDGVLAGIVGRTRPVDRLAPQAAFAWAVLIQAAHLGFVGLILLATQPDVLAEGPARFAHVAGEVVGNALGVALFVLILRTALLSTEREVALTRQEAATARARLSALQAQIQPHFLYNTLNTISHLVRTKPDDARALLGKLADFYRHTVRKSASDVTLGEELETVERYLDIEAARYGDRLHRTIDVTDEARARTVPPLLLQPLVENAVQHGIAPSKGGGTVRVSARLDAGWLVIEVSDDGIGYDGQRLGVGLTNVRERLDARSAGRARFSIQGEPGVGTRVEVGIPAP